MSSLKQQAVRGLKWQAIEIAGRQVLGLVVFTTLARLLDPSAFGLVAMVGVYLAFVAMFAEQGLATALIQRLDLQPEHLHTAFWFTNVAGLLLFGLSQLLAPWVAGLMAEPQLEPLLRWASLSLVISSLTCVHGALFAREMDFRRPAVRTLLANLIGGTVGISLAVGGYGVWALVFQQLTAAAVGSSFIWAVSAYRPMWSFSWLHLRDLLGMSSAVFATGLLWFVASRADQFFIGRYLSAASLGLYNVGGKLPELARLAVVQPISGVSLPSLSRLGADNPRLCASIVRGVEIVSFVICPVFLGLVATAESLVLLLFGEKWLPAVPMLQALACYQLLCGLFVFCHPALIASGGPGAYVFVNLGCALGAVTVSWIAVNFNATSVAVGLCINLLATGIVALLFLKKRIGLSPTAYLKPFISPLLISLVSAIFAYSAGLISQNYLPIYATLIIQIVIGGITYSLGVAIVSPPGYQELRSIWTEYENRRREPITRA